MPTVAASVALSPDHETWVLDDGHRDEIRRLAERLGARYLTRPDNAFAKAGNLNHALGEVQATSSPSWMPITFRRPISCSRPSPICDPRSLSFRRRRISTTSTRSSTNGAATAASSTRRPSSTA